MAKTAKIERPEVDELRFTSAPEVKRIASDLIGKHHTHLVNVQIVYVFRDTATKKNGKVVLGKARKISGLSAFLANETDEFFVLEIPRDEWLLLNDAQRLALVDHELCHFTTDPDTGKLALVPHDLEEFTDVVRRHGLWKADVRSFAKVAAQAKLPLEEVSEGE